jgi:hypothetical protein
LPFLQLGHARAGGREQADRTGAGSRRRGQRGGVSHSATVFFMRRKGKERSVSCSVLPPQETTAQTQDTRGQAGANKPTARVQAHDAEVNAVAFAPHNENSNVCNLSLRLRKSHSATVFFMRRKGKERSVSCSGAGSRRRGQRGGVCASQRKHPAHRFGGQGESARWKGKVSRAVRQALGSTQELPQSDPIQVRMSRKRDQALRSSRTWHGTT